MNSKKDEIAALLRETAAAHHDAFLDQDGDDPEWPLWYATYLHDRLPPLLGRALTRSELVFALVHLERQLAAEGAGAPWPEYYAAHLLERYATA